jgi:hypothetical protein
MKGAIVMKTRKTALLGTLITMMILAVGCGSASAPPVDLPAPITGRIDVSSPDANGDVTVTGTEGAVTGGAIVLVVNEDEAGSASMMIYDMLVPSAYAQTFPAICEEVWRACTEAAEDGSFQVVIPAAVGDTLVIGLINDEGEWRSDTIRVVVPASGTPDPEANCLDEGVAGAVVDVKIAPTSGIPVMLKQGSDTTTNQLVIGATSPTTVAITGCHAHSIAFFESATGDSIAVTSKEDKVLWAGRFVAGDVLDTKTFTLEYEPMHIAFVNYPTQPIVAIRKTSNTVRLARISLSEGLILDEMILNLDDPPSINEVTDVTRSTAIDVLKMGTDGGQYIGLLIVDNGNAANSYLTLYQADGIVHKATWSRATVSGFSDVGPIASMVDGIFYVYEAASEYFVRLAITDSTSTENVLLEFDIWKDSFGNMLQWTELLNAINTFYNVIAKLKTVPDTDPTVPLKKLAIMRPPMSPPACVITNSNGQLYQRELGTFATGIFKWIADWALGHDIVAIDTSVENELLYGADATAGSVINGSSYPTW